MAGSGKVNGTPSLWARLTAKKKRKRNPSSSKTLQLAQDFYRDFHWGDEAKKLKRARFSKTPKVATELGTLAAITYETMKNGEKALWEHTFGEEGGKRPKLVADPKNKKLHIVGGDYTITERGIID